MLNISFATDGRYTSLKPWLAVNPSALQSDTSADKPEGPGPPELSVEQLEAVRLETERAEQAAMKDEQKAAIENAVKRAKTIAAQRLRELRRKRDAAQEQAAREHEQATRKLEQQQAAALQAMRAEIEAVETRVRLSFPPSSDVVSHSRVAFT
jgi:superfamily II RNA helicase